MSKNDTHYMVYFVKIRYICYYKNSICCGLVTWSDYKILALETFRLGHKIHRMLPMAETSLMTCNVIKFIVDNIHLFKIIYRFSNFVALFIEHTT